MSFQNQVVPKKKESVLGIISCVIALTSLAFFICLILVGVYLESATPGGMQEDSSISVIFGLFLILIIPVSFLGAVLGFIGIFQTSKKKIFPVSGAFLNSLLFGGMIVAILFGIMTQ
jgi:hypothetical protein